ncbi:MAG: VWA domain-containing protein [Candidatus Omnitrophota bacterium]|nr:MAG: VWA domain-containing protein [Candidatus Omnitrophota bacterium]
MSFYNPYFLLLLLFVAGCFIYVKLKKSRYPGVKFSSGMFVRNLKPTLKVALSQNLIFLRMASLVFIVFALARPQSPVREERIETEGIDIILALDVSGSMLAEDFTLQDKRANRLSVVKEVVKDFIQVRESDRIGMVVFAARAYTAAPLTLDYSWLLQNLERVKIGMIEDGTAIGSGLASALNRLKDTKAKSKIIILLTDGRNNAGKISPLTAAEAANSLGVKVYTIGAGTKGLAPFPVADFFGRTVYQKVKIDIDEDTLKEIAEKTKGKYFRATDTDSLKEIYQEIDKMEKTSIEERGYAEYKELFSLFLIPGLLLLLGEIILTNTVIRRFP